MSDLATRLDEIRLRAGDLHSSYLIDSADGDTDIDRYYGDDLDELQHHTLKLIKSHESTEWPELPKADVPVFTRINQTMAWVEAVYRLVEGKDWRPAFEVAQNAPMPVWARDANWTDLLGREVRLRIRDCPGIHRTKLVKEFGKRPGGSRVKDYLGFLTKPGGNRTKYSAYTRGRGRESPGYFMSRDAFIAWSQRDDDEFAKWMEKQRREGLLPFGYEDAD